jgi:hypothetical protein
MRNIGLGAGKAYVRLGPAADMGTMLMIKKFNVRDRRESIKYLINNSGVSKDRGRKKNVVRGGIEPSTRGFSVHCSTD